MFRACGTYTQAYTQPTPKFSRKIIRQWPPDGNYSMTNFAQWPLYENYSMTNFAQWSPGENYSMNCDTSYLLPRTSYFKLLGVAWV